MKVHYRISCPNCGFYQVGKRDVAVYNMDGAAEHTFTRYCDRCARPFAIGIMLTAKVKVGTIQYQEERNDENQDA